MLFKREEKYHSKPNTAEIVRQALETKVTFNIQVLMNSFFKQQPVEVRFRQIVQGITIRLHNSISVEV